MNEKDVMITLNTKQSDGVNSEQIEIITNKIQNIVTAEHNFL